MKNSRYSHAVYKHQSDRINEFQYINWDILSQNPNISFEILKKQYR